MKLKDLVTDSAEPDRMSHTKLWANIAYATATVVFAMQSYKGTLDADVWLIYLGVCQTACKTFQFWGGNSVQ